MEIRCPQCGASTSDQFPCIDCKSMLPIADGIGFDVNIILDKKHATYAGLKYAIEKYAGREDVEAFEPLRIISKGGVIVSIFRGGMLRSMDRREMPYFHSPRIDSVCLVLIFDISNPNAGRGLELMEALKIGSLFNAKASDSSTLEFMFLDCYKDLGFCEAMCSLILDKVVGLSPGSNLHLKLEDEFDFGDSRLWGVGHYLKLKQCTKFRFSAVRFRELLSDVAIATAALFIFPFGFVVASLLFLRSGIVGLGICIDAKNMVMSFPTTSKMYDRAQSASITEALFRFLTRSKIYFKDIEYVGPAELLHLPIQQARNRAHLVVEGSFGEFYIPFCNADERNRAYEVLIEHLQPQVKEYIRISNRMT